MTETNAAALAEWFSSITLTGSLEDDVETLAALDRIKRECARVLDELGPQVAEMMPEDVWGDRVERKWRSPGWTWDKSADVIDALADAWEWTPEQRAAVAMVAETLPLRVAWRTGDVEDPDKPGLRRLGLDPDELRHRNGKGKWTLNFLGDET